LSPKADEANLNLSILKLRCIVSFKPLQPERYVGGNQMKSRLRISQKLLRTALAKVFITNPKKDATLSQWLKREILPLKENTRDLQWL